jgi:hypothetical protein
MCWDLGQVEVANRCEDDLSKKKRNRCEDSWAAKSGHHHHGHIQSLLFTSIVPVRCHGFNEGMHLKEDKKIFFIVFVHNCMQYNI